MIATTEFGADEYVSRNWVLIITEPRVKSDSFPLFRNKIYFIATVYLSIPFSQKSKKAMYAEVNKSF